MAFKPFKRRFVGTTESKTRIFGIKQQFKHGDVFEVTEAVASVLRVGDEESFDRAFGPVGFEKIEDEED